ncbi:Nudix hydrolase domain-containing protein OS=Stutzerimonas stutzeri OX=316 GN=CXK99_09085 PE=4 SV=1 [Stutzerimonas stutzeri]
MQLAPNEQPAAAVVIVEPDWRMWVAHVCEPFNAAQVRFPAARQDASLSLPATAIREAWETTGLQVRITGWLGDFDTPTTRTRYYLAERIGGAPHACGWQTPALSLVSCEALADFPALRLGGADSQSLVALGNVLMMLKAATVSH